MWGFKSLHSFFYLEELYKKCISPVRICLQVRKARKCIYKLLKNFRVEKSGEISRNLRLSFYCLSLLLHSSLLLITLPNLRVSEKWRVKSEKINPQGQVLGDFWLGWQDSDLRNARVKVWCLTAWLHPSIILFLPIFWQSIS